jgi:5-methyltetrahydrofolate--homocysteine methyltransferase
MLVIGELLNSTRKEMKDALSERNETAVRRLARQQVEAGADILDVNTATSMDKETGDQKWVIDIIQEEVENARIAIDTPNAKAMETGIKLCRNKPVVNSISNEARAKDLLPIIKGSEADVIGLSMGGATRMPNTVDERLKESDLLIGSLDKAGIDLHRLFVDPLAMSIASNQDQARIAVQSIREIKERYGNLGVKTTVGLSNVSFGLPRRGLLNQAFLVLLIEAGLDMAIMNPLDKRNMGILRASEALLGADASCLNYIRFTRKARV